MAATVQVGQRVTGPFKGVWNVVGIDDAQTPALDDADEITNRLAYVQHPDGPFPPAELSHERWQRWFSFDELTIVE